VFGGRRISELLLELYEFPDGCDFYVHTLDVLGRYVPASVLSYAFTDISTGQIEDKEIHDLRGREDPDLNAVNPLLRAHPFTEYYIRNQGAPVLSIDDLMSDEEWERTATYNELYRPHGVSYDTSVRFYRGKLCVSFAFTDTAPMSAEHRRTLNLIAPHLGMACRSFSLQQRGVAEQLPAHMALLTKQGKLREISSDAADLLDRYFSSEKRRSRKGLPSAVSRWVQQQVAGAEQGLVPAKFAVRAESRVLTLSMMPYAAGWVLAMDEISPPSAISVFTGMGLTLREAEVLVWLVQGKQNEDIGLILDISKQTVRKHVENILHKLHCETRGAAAMLAMHTLTERTHGFSFGLDPF
jgi:DNA-binding CsgD family transcriptional regulator